VVVVDNVKFIPVAGYDDEQNAFRNVYITNQLDSTELHVLYISDKESSDEEQVPTSA